MGLRILTVCLMAGVTLCATAQEKDKIVMTSTVIGTGNSDLLETYLSPQDYSGWNFAVQHERVNPVGASGNLVGQHWFNLIYSSNGNRPGNGLQVAGELTYRWGLMRRWNMGSGLSLYAGGVAMAEAGFVYNLRNGNNPATGNAYGGVGGTGMAVYRLDRGWFGKLPLTMRAQFVMPLAGVFFSPHYGQSYYEIFSLGNTAGIVKFGSLHNRFDMDNIVSMDMDLGCVAIRLEYMSIIRNSDVNDLKSRRVTNTWMIGVTRELIRVNRKTENGGNALRVF